jgi:exonuclease VII large subunit
MEKQLTARQSRVALLSDKLNALGPRQALQRGYAVVRSGKKAVTRVEDAAERMTVLMQDGRILVRTLEIKKEDPFGQEANEL